MTQQPNAARDQNVVSEMPILRHTFSTDIVSVPITSALLMRTQRSRKRLRRHAMTVSRWTKTSTSRHRAQRRSQWCGMSFAHASYGSPNMRRQRVAVCTSRRTVT